MQPPIEYFADDLTLPPAEQGPGYLCFVTKKYKYVSLSFRRRDGTGAVESYTIHQVDARRLLETLERAVAEEAEDSFALRLFGGAEGFAKGGPPERADLLEFMSVDEQARVRAENARRNTQSSERPSSRAPWWRFWS